MTMQLKVKNQKLEGAKMIKAVYYCIALSIFVFLPPFLFSQEVDVTWEPLIGNTETGYNMGFRNCADNPDVVVNGNQKGREKNCFFSVDREHNDPALSLEPLFKSDYFLTNLGFWRPRLTLTGEESTGGDIIEYRSNMIAQEGVLIESEIFSGVNGNSSGIQKSNLTHNVLDFSYENLNALSISPNQGMGFLGTSNNGGVSSTSFANYNLSSFDFVRDWGPTQYAQGTNSFIMTENEYIEKQLIFENEIEVFANLNVGAIHNISTNKLKIDQRAITFNEFETASPAQDNLSINAQGILFSDENGALTNIMPGKIVTPALDVNGNLKVTGTITGTTNFNDINLTGKIEIGNAVSSNPQLAITDEGDFAQIQSYNGVLKLNPLGYDITIGDVGALSNLTVNGNLDVSGMISGSINGSSENSKACNGDASCEMNGALVYNDYLSVISNNGVAPITPPLFTQGLSMGWNASGGTGEVNFYNNFSGAASQGGYSFKQKNSGGTYDEIMTLEPDGDLIVKNDLTVESGKIILKSDWTIETPDYVFEPDYKLPKLNEVEAFVKKHKHLPEIPSSKEFNEKGMDLAEMNLKLLKKIEELTLYVIDQKNEIDEIKAVLKYTQNKIGDK